MRTLISNFVKGEATKYYMLPAIFIFAILAIFPAFANYSISPIFLDFQPGDKVLSVSVTNNNERDVKFQVVVKKWNRSAEGTDILEDTKDLIVTPVIFKLPASQTQLIRVSPRGLQPGEIEKSYKIIIKELPEAKEKLNGVNIIMQFAVPIFIAPSKLNHGELECGLGGEGKKITVTCRNNRNDHVLLTNLEVMENKRILRTFKIAHYVFPGQKVKYDFDHAGDINGKDARLVTFYHNSRQDVKLRFGQKLADYRDTSPPTPSAKEEVHEIEEVNSQAEAGNWRQ